GSRRPRAEGPPRFRRGRPGALRGAPGAGRFRYTCRVSDFLLADRIVRPTQNRLEGPEGSIQVEPKVMEVLVCLARQPGAVVGKDELVREVWEGRFVSDDVVWRSIRELRRALGDDARTAGFIETIPKRGYRLIPQVAPLPALSEEAPQDAERSPRL